MERRVIVRKAHDCTDGCELGSPDCRPGAGGFHGIGDADITFALIAEGAAVTCSFSSGWYKQTTRERVLGARKDISYIYMANGGGVVAWHYARPWGAAEHGECVYIGECWSGISYLLAEEMFDLLTAQGSDALWNRLTAEMAIRQQPE